VTALENDLPTLYSHCNSFFIRGGVYGKFGLINVHLFEIACNSCRRVREKSGIFFFCMERGNLVH